MKRKLRYDIEMGAYIVTIFTCILLGFLVVCAIAASLSKNLLNTILIFMSYSLVMSIIWILLESPDLAITEAAVGAGVTTVLFLVTLKKIDAIKKDGDGGQDNNIERNDIVEENRNVKKEGTCEIDGNRRRGCEEE